MQIPAQSPSELPSDWVALPPAIMALRDPDRAVRRAIGRTHEFHRDKLLVVKLGDRLYLTAVGATWRVGISEDLLADLEVTIAALTADP